jgi:hypothetical protein
MPRSSSILEAYQVAVDSYVTPLVPPRWKIAGCHMRALKLHAGCMWPGALCVYSFCDLVLRPLGFVTKLSCVVAVMLAGRYALHISGHSVHQRLSVHHQSAGWLRLYGNAGSRQRHPTLRMWSRGVDGWVEQQVQRCQPGIQLHVCLLVGAGCTALCLGSFKALSLMTLRLRGISSSSSVCHCYL